MNRSKNVEEIVEGFKLMRQHLRGSSCSVSELPLTHSQWLALMVIGRGHLVTIGDVKKALGISSSAATQLANNLEEKGHVIRTPLSTDARASVLVLSSDSKKKFEHMRTKKLKEFTKLFDVFTDDEFSTYVQLLAKLTKSISK